MAAADTNKKGWPGTLCGKPARLSDTVDELYGKGIITARLRFMLGNLADIGTLRDILTDTRTEKRLWKDFGFRRRPVNEMMEIKARYSYLLTDTATTANVQALAAGYALANTSTRCSLMRDTSNCEACTVRNCDFRSRYEAFRAGYGCREAEERQNNDYQTCNTPII